MRIALVYPQFNVMGSLPREQVELARYLIRAGHEVHAYAYRATSDPDLAPGTRFHHVPATRASDSRLGAALHAATFREERHRDDRA
jgi:hypothetical protein